MKTLPKDGIYKFIGTDGSLGYRRGALYFLRLAHDTYPVRIFEAVGFETKDGRPCPYSSVESFERNWQPVESDGHKGTDGS